MSTSEIRWAMNIARWKPTGCEWAQALSLINEKEQERICKFSFKRDAKASLAGQLMLHKLVRETLKIPNNLIQVARTDRGKPYFPTVDLPLSFNVSHQGAYTVMAASPKNLLGVDIMRVDDERFESDSKLHDFFYTMRRQFTNSEWKNIRCGTNSEKLLNFYRNWCLKESYVKAVGVGININLQALDFIVQQPLQGVVTSTALKIDGVIEDAWYFEEQLIDEKHCVCVASKPATGVAETFRILHIEDLIVSTEHENERLKKWAEDFEAKEEEPQLRRNLF